MIYSVSCGYSQSPLYRHPVIVLIRPHDTSHYYGQFALSQVGKKALTFLHTDTPLTSTDPFYGPLSVCIYLS